MKPTRSILGLALFEQWEASLELRFKRNTNRDSDESLGGVASVNASIARFQPKSSVKILYSLKGGI